MMRHLGTMTLVMVGLLSGSIALAQKNAKGLWTDAKDPTLPIDFAIQGEYSGDKIGVQVIALGEGKFQAVVLPGGLPGAGWDGKNKSLMDGKLDGKTAVFAPPTGKKKYLAKSPEEFSAVSKFPPEGQVDGRAKIVDGVMTLSLGDKQIELKKTERKSETLGKAAPSGAVILFDGGDTDAWQGGRLDKKTKLLNTDGKDIKTKKKFNDYEMHVEFLLPFKPAARGQGRGNSGFYQVDHYEVQILDSFGLEGRNNECGGIYTKKAPDVNACLPPLTWQTYDVEFTNAEVEGDKLKRAVITVRHNGIVIHDKVEIQGKTGGSRNEPIATPGPIKLQGHGNPLQFRNVWIVEK